MPSKRCTATCCAHRAPAPEAKRARPLIATGLAGFIESDRLPKAYTFSLALKKSLKLRSFGGICRQLAYTANKVHENAACSLSMSNIRPAAKSSSTSQPGITRRSEAEPR